MSRCALRSKSRTVGDLVSRAPYTRKSRPALQTLALALIGAVGVTTVLGSPPARAAEGSQELVGRWAYERLNRAHEALNAGKMADALTAMDEMSRKLALNDYERALMWQTYGYIYSSQEKLAKAAEAFEKALGLNTLPEGAQLNTQFNLGQIYLAAENYPKAVATLEDWLSKVQNPTGTAYYMLAAAYAQQKKFDKALVHARRMLSTGETPRESWLQLVLSIHYELKHMRDMADVLKRLCELYPKKAYWMQLSAAYSELKMEKEALAVLELAYAQGYLTDQSAVMSLAQLYLYHAIPLKAAQVIEKGFADGIVARDEKTLSLLGNALLNANEYARALAPLQEAAKLSRDGDVYIRVAQIHLDDENWEKAIAAVREALAQPKLTDPGNANVLLGISYYQAKDFGAARKAFLKARESDKSRATADKWLDILAKASAPKGS